MASLVLNGNTSGSVTISSPAVSGTNTLTLPANTGTVILSDASANIQFNSGYGSVATAFGCRAWVNFNGTGTPAIRASGNVTSITDNGTGTYAVNFTTAMPDANYAVPVGGSRDAFAVTADHQIGVYGFSTTSISLACRTEGGAYIDFQFVTCAIFR
jgi:hypothetical protein